jgi:putative oxidoreductase
MDLGRLALRGIIGPLFVGHGTQKLFGWFGGHGPDATGGAFEGMGLRPGKRHATAAGVAETAGGALLTLGALTPLASTVVSSVMLTAIRKVHLKNGPWATQGGWEYNAAVIGAVTALTEVGPGTPSVDGALWPGLKGPKLALLALAAAGAGSFLATSERFTQALSSAETPSPAPSEPAVPEPERKFTREPAEEPASAADQHADQHSGRPA